MAMRLFLCRSIDLVVDTIVLFTPMMVRLLVVILVIRISSDWLWLLRTRGKVIGILGLKML